MLKEHPAIRTHRTTLAVTIALLLAGCNGHKAAVPQQPATAPSPSNAQPQERAQAAPVEPQSPIPVEPQTAQERAWGKIRAGARLVDVRTQGEFDAGHLQGAIVIPYDEIAARIAAAAPDKAKPIVIYCRSGRRSIIALGTLKGMGYTDVTDGGSLPDMKAAK